MTTTVLRKLHKIDSTGRPRHWWAEHTDTAYRTHAGIAGGTIVTSDWFEVAEGKQGRTQAEQVEFMVQAMYVHRLERDYFELHEDASAPKVIFPMLAHKYEAKKFQPGYVQPKLDGMRCIATARGLFSRQGKPIESVPHIVQALAPLFVADPDLILDGELYNHALKHDFERLMSLCRKSGKSLTPEVMVQTRQVQYHIYDVASAQGDVSERLLSLDKLSFDMGEGNLSLGGFAYLLDTGHVELVNTFIITTEAQYDYQHNKLLGQGYEGTVWRAQGAQEIAGYEFDKRSKRLLKRTDKLTQEFPVSRLVEGNGNWAGAVRTVECLLPDGRTFEANITGTYEANAERLSQTFKHVTVEFKGWTKDNKPRAAMVKDWDRDDVSVPTQSV